MINLLTIAPYNFLPAHTGGQKAMFLLYKYIARKVNITCVSTQTNDLSKAPFEVLPLFSDSPLRYINPLYFFKLKKLIRKRDISHVSIEHPYMGMLGLMLKNMCEVKLIVRSHNIEAVRFKSLNKWWWPLLQWYERYVHRRADHSFFITEEDRLYAVEHYKLAENKTSVLTYGSEIAQSMSIQEKKEEVKKIKAAYKVPQEMPLLLFNGSFNYEPNLNALQLLLNKILPLLLEKTTNFHLLVCGKNIPESIMNTAFPQTTIAGFVDDIDAVFKGSDIFLNPVWQGGGIKTKLVEALCYSCSAVSFENGAIGIPENIVDGKISIVDDEDSGAFADAVIHQASTTDHVVPHKFYFHFAWENIAQRFVDKINTMD